MRTKIFILVERGLVDAPERFMVVELFLRVVFLNLKNIVVGRVERCKEYGNYREAKRFLRMFKRMLYLAD
ncbi:hypothetical protein [Teredinibacter turnerae]|uniref:hypothetical protein n=1 Tax=Teredinibacter turnerae TaxID=2426 RepID=UPI00035F2D63|nr:hypothetical protein [Teredinibacter turnerae]